jgi:hypothetical protein
MGTLQNERTECAPVGRSLPVRVKKKMDAATLRSMRQGRGVNLVPAGHPVRDRMPSRDMAMSTRERAVLAPLA